MPDHNVEFAQIDAEARAVADEHMRAQAEGGPAEQNARRAVEQAQRRSRGVRRTMADCPTCGEVCEAGDWQPDAHRMWAQRHADRTGHTTSVESIAVRTYTPRVPPETEDSQR